jgi:hypothetical protein
VKLIRDAWTPLTVTIETHEEAEILHKILANVVDDTAERDAQFLNSLFMALGKGLDATPTYVVTYSQVIVTDAKKY